MTIFVTSDLHISHKNIIKYCPESRGHFSSFEEMNDVIVKNWNSKVSPRDYVYLIGDVAFGNVDVAIETIQKLNGMIHLIMGNHDSGFLKNRKFSSRFCDIDQYRAINHDGKKVCMFHFPILEWDQKHRQSYHLHGHKHSKNYQILSCRRYDVGIDGSPDFAPYNLSDLLIDIESRQKDPNKVTNHHY